MADDLLQLYLRELVEAYAASPEVVAAWQGGEPTMIGLDFFRRSVELAEAVKRPGQRIVHTIQTARTATVPQRAGGAAGVFRLVTFEDPDFDPGFALDLAPRSRARFSRRPYLPTMSVRR